jgi:DNA invertase Pin-like site-specific DNA recombinase
MRARAATYTLVSHVQRKSRRPERSVDQQQGFLEADARGEGLRISERHSDPDISASRFARTTVRPGWNALRATVRQRRIDVVMLWEVSRASRERADFATFLNECRAAKVRVYVRSDMRTYDLENPSDWAALASAGISSVVESERISARTKRGIIDIQAEGRNVGRIPYGYQHVRDENELPQRVPDPRTVPAVRFIFASLAAATPVMRLRAELDAAGYPTPGGSASWSRSSIRSIAANIAYTGRPPDGTDATWEPVIDRALWGAANEALRERAGRRPATARWLLSYIMTCGACGAPVAVIPKPFPRAWRDSELRVEWDKGSGAVYRCTKNVCGCVLAAPVDWADWLMTESLIRWAIRPGVYEALTAGNNELAARLDGEIAAERVRLNAFETEAIATGSPALARVITGIESALTALSAERDSAVADPAVLRLIGHGEPGADIRETVALMELPTLRRVISTIAEPVLNSPKGGQAIDSPFRLKPNFRDDPRERALIPDFDPVKFPARGPSNPRKIRRRLKHQSRSLPHGISKYGGRKNDERQDHEEVPRGSRHRGSQYQYR